MNTTDTLQRCVLIGLLMLLGPLTALATDQHRVLPGDTLWTLAEHYWGDADRWSDLARYNRITDVHQLPPGTLLSLTPPPVAQVTHVQGDAWLLTDADLRALENDALLQANVRLQTGVDAFLVLSFADGSEAVIPSQTRVRLVHADDSIQLTLEAGAVESHIAPQKRLGGFQVHTPAGIIGVRGTRFRVQYQPDQSLAVSVFSGAVALDLPALAADAQPLQDNQGYWQRGDQHFQGPLLPAPALRQNWQRRGTSLQLELEPVAGARFYRIGRARDQRFTTLVEEHTVSEPKVVLQQVTEPALYLRVSALDEHGIEGQIALHVLWQQRAP
ncbi:FecR family protein [Isoalcanivorax beigongshangi]|uniref:FecR domain-containing protein n=1 Tax=Isoalcanivorax beigongshangi TaxID=3238810 RepID=A0ABV4AMS6_9GAMM